MIVQFTALESDTTRIIKTPVCPQQCVYLVFYILCTILTFDHWKSFRKRYIFRKCVLPKAVMWNSTYLLTHPVKSTLTFISVLELSS